MTCPQCGKWSKVIETRQRKAGAELSRRRECGNGHRFSTMESVKADAIKEQQQ